MMRRHYFNGPNGVLKVEKTSPAAANPMTDPSMIMDMMKGKWRTAGDLDGRALKGGTILLQYNLHYIANCCFLFDCTLNINMPRFRKPH